MGTVIQSKKSARYEEVITAENAHNLAAVFRDKTLSSLMALIIAFLHKTRVQWGENVCRCIAIMTL